MKSLAAVNPFEDNYRGSIGSGRWTLCLGAGISRGIAPTWFDLTLQIVNEAFQVSYSSEQFKEIVANSGWGLDALIQAAANEFRLRGESEASFVDLIESILYSNLRRAAVGLPLEKHLIRALNNPRTIPKSRVFEICEFIETIFHNSSVVGVAKFLINAAEQFRAPESVITFNADTLLETLIILLLRRAHYLKPGPHGHPNFFYQSVRRPQDMKKGLICIYHCHGTIMPRRAELVKNSRDGRDRLVFLEKDYLRIASNSASWPETLFQFHSQTSRMLFAGLSMSDANIRRWMASTDETLAKDYELLAKGQLVNPKHLWFTRKPTDPAIERLELVSLVHLGIRPAWLEDWSQISNALSNVLGLPRVD